MIELTSSRLGDVYIRDYLEQLCESIGASMIPDHKQLNLDVNVDDSAVPAVVGAEVQAAGA